MQLSSFIHFWQSCTKHVPTSGAYFHFITESNNSLLVHAEFAGKTEHDAPQGPQQGQQNLTYSPITGGSGGSHHPSPTYRADIAPVLICSCLSRGSTEGLVVHRSRAAARGGDLELGSTERPRSSWVSIQEGGETGTKKSFSGRNRTILSSGGENSTAGSPKEQQ